MTIRVEAKRYDATVHEPWWKILRANFTRLDDDGWLFVLTGRSVLHFHKRGWWITVEPLREPRIEVTVDKQQMARLVTTGARKNAAHQPRAHVRRDPEA